MENHLLSFFYLYACVVLQNNIECINIANNGIENSYAVFPKWTSQQNVKILTFKFKTKQKNGLLLLINDGPKNENELKLSLVSGSLYFSFKMGSEDMLSVKEASLGTEWNDMAWHNVRIEQRFREVFVGIDQYEYNLFTEGLNDWLILTSSVFIGGSLINSFEGFTGCVESLNYEGMTSPNMAPTQTMGNVKDYCMDQCTLEEKEKCKNNGKCIKFFSEGSFECDCKGTGYKGNECEAEEVTGFFTEMTFLTRSMDALQNFRSNKVSLRFRTVTKNGVILYSSHSRAYILIEIVNGRIFLAAKFGTDPIRFTSKFQYHDGRWHSIVIKRSGSNVSMEIDFGRDVSTQILMYQPSELCSLQKQKIFVGGHHYPQSIESSQSKKNFIGCLQQVYFQEDNIELISQSQLDSDIYTKIVGNELVFWKCPVSGRDIKQEPLERLLASSNLNGQMSRKKLDHRTVAWLTTGICLGIILLVASLGIALHYTRKRYSGRFTAKFQKNGKKYGTSRAPSIELNMDISEKRKHSGKRFLTMANV